MDQKNSVFWERKRQRPPKKSKNKRSQEELNDLIRRHGLLDETSDIHIIPVEDFHRESFLKWKFPIIGRPSAIEILNFCNSDIEICFSKLKKYISLNDPTHDRRITYTTESHLRNIFYMVGSELECLTKGSRIYYKKLNYSSRKKSFSTPGKESILISFIYYEDIND